ncbi:MAG: putative Ig domain-containing protein [archaeon]
MKNNIMRLTCIFVLLAVVAQFASSYPFPFGLDGTVFDRSASAQAPSFVTINFTNLNSGYFISGHIGQGKNTGKYSVSFPAQAGDEVLIIASSGYSEANRTIILNASSMHNINLYLDISIQNIAPIITTSPITNATESLLYFYDVDAIDENNDLLTYMLLVYPDNMTINQSSGIITWLPDKDQTGQNDVVVAVSDSLINTTQFFSIYVEAINHVPQIIGTTCMNATVGILYTCSILAKDLDNDPIQYSIIESPQNLSINIATGNLSYLPSIEDVGENNVTVNAYDGKNSSYVTFQIYVSEKENSAPYFTTFPATSVLEDFLYYYDADAYDLDNDLISYSLEKSPSGMEIDSMNGIISWTSLNENVGINEVTIIADDSNGGIAKQSYNLTVINVNDAPVITSQPLKKASLLRLYSYYVKAIDPDNDRITYKLLEAPRGMRINKLTGRILWLPVNPFYDSVSVRIQASDGQEETVQSFVITVDVTLKNLFLFRTFSVFAAPESIISVDEDFSQTVRFTPNDVIDKIIIETNDNTSEIGIIIDSDELRPDKISVSPDIFVYRYLDISSEDLGDDESARINFVSIKSYFKISKEWLNKYNINKESISLYSYSSGTWNKKELNYQAENSDYFFFESTLDSLGIFAIGSYTLPDVSLLSPAITNENLIITPTVFVAGNVFYKDNKTLSSPISFTVKNKKTAAAYSGYTTGPGNIKSFYSAKINAEKGDRITLEFRDGMQKKEVEVLITGDYLNQDIYLDYSKSGLENKKIIGAFSILSLFVILIAVIIMAIKNKRPKFLLLSLILYSLLILPCLRADPPTPHPLQGFVFSSNGIAQVPIGTPVRATDIVNSYTILIYTSGPPIPGLGGFYGVTINGVTGDTIVVRAWNTTNYGETYKTLALTTTYINVTLNRTRPSEASVRIIVPANNTEVLSDFNVTANVTILGGNGVNCNATVSFSKPGIFIAIPSYTITLGNINFGNSQIAVFNISVNGTGSSDINVFAQCASDLLNLENKSSATVYNITSIDLAPPQISIISPQNNSRLNNPVSFFYSVTDASEISNCTIFVNGLEQDTIESPQKTVILNFTIDITTKENDWQINCTDAVELTGATGRYNLTINDLPRINSVSMNNPINLVAALDTFVSCNGTVFDNDGISDITSINATFFNADMGLTNISADNSSTHYTNSSCVLTSFDSKNAGFNCTFALKYYSLNGTWQCNPFVLDIINASNSTILNVTLNELIAISIEPSILNYGNLKVDQESSDIIANITNYGNIQTDLQFFGYANSENDNLSMTCETGIIPLSYQRYSLSAWEVFTDMLLLGGRLSPNAVDLNISVQDTAEQSSKQLYWKLKIPFNTMGTCNGKVVFMAVSG